MRRLEWHEFPSLAFDVEGTLLNSNLARVWAWQEAVEEQHLFFPHFTALLQLGQSPEIFAEKYLFALQNRAAADEIAARAGALYAERYSKLVRPHEGMARLLARLKARGHHLYALATTTSGGTLSRLLSRFKLDRAFDGTFFTALPFSRLRERIGVRAPLLSFGDSPYDFKAATAAGVPFVHLGAGGFPREWFKSAFASFFNAAELLASLPKNRASGSPASRSRGPSKAA